MRALRNGVAGIATTAVAALIAVAAAGCGSDEPNRADDLDASVLLRADDPVVLLEEVALDGSWCVRTIVADEAEGQLAGAEAFGGQAFFEVVDGATDTSNVSVTVDRFSSAAEARDEAGPAGAELAALVGVGSIDEGPLGEHEDSVVHARTVTDFEGQPRATFGAAVPVDDAVVRITSFGVASIPDLAAFTTVAERLIDGLTGAAPVASVPPCGG